LASAQENMLEGFFLKAKAPPKTSHAHQHKRSLFSNFQHIKTQRK